MFTLQPSKFEHEIEQTVIGITQWPAFITCGFVYFLYAQHLGPAFMKRHRRQFNVNSLKIVFDLFMIFSSVILLNEFFSSGFTFGYLYECHRPEHSTKTFRNAMYYTCLLNFVQFLQLAFVILEKRKYTVHETYFTISSALLATFHVKYIGGGSSVFPFVLSLSINCALYIFELVSSVKLITSKYFKSVITFIEIIQFILIQIYCTATVFNGCTNHNIRLFFYFTTPDLFVVLHMFYKKNSKIRLKMGKNTNVCSTSCGCKLFPYK